MLTFGLSGNQYHTFSVTCEDRVLQASRHYRKLWRYWAKRRAVDQTYISQNLMEAEAKRKYKVGQCFTST